MGLLADTFGSLARFVPERKTVLGSTVPTWESGTPQTPRESYYRYALDGYSSNEVFFACVEELATSAAEPRLVAVKRGPKGPEQIKDHPVLDLFERPNPFTSRYGLIASLIMYRSVSGNAYLEKVRSAAGQVVELWPLRPDRMWVIPDDRKYIRGYEYRIGGEVDIVDVNDIVHFKTRNPLDDWYGMPPARPASIRMDSANAMRSFTHAFFVNAGVPAGLLTVQKQVNAAERQLIRDRFRNEAGGASGWHSLMVLDNTEATYTPMGLPLGERGLVMPDLDDIIDAKSAMVFGVPLELIGARLSMRGQRSAAKEARAGFWDETLAPLYQDIAAMLTIGLAGEFDGFDYLEFDLSTVKALQEDDDAKHGRLRADMLAGGISIQEFRTETGREPDFEPGAILMVPDNISPLPAEQLAAPPPPAPSLQPVGGASDPASRNGGATNGHATPADLAALAALAAGR